MANTFNLGNGNWAQKTEKLLAYNAENDNYKPLPFDFDRASTATRVNKQGLIETVATDEPRIDFLNNTKGHLLLEPSRQNVVDNSTNFFINSWTGTRVEEGSTIVSPNGNDEAHKLVATSVSNTHYRVYTYSSASAGSYTASAFFKKDEYEVGVVRIDADDAANRIGVAINISNGTFISQNTTGTPTGTSYKIEDYGSGWYRLSVTINHTSGSVRSNISTAPLNFTWSNGLPVFLGNSSDGGYAWGAQLEAGSYATSYIPTQGSAVTRSAETCNGAGNSTVFNDSEGVLFAEIAVLEGDTSVVQLSLSNGTDNENIKLLQLNSTTVRAEVKMSAESNFVEDITIDAENLNKFAVQYKADDYKVFVNGIKQSVGQRSTTPTGLDTLNFDRGDGASDFYGKIKDLRVYNTALTDAELIALTT